MPVRLGGELAASPTAANFELVYPYTFSSSSMVIFFFCLVGFFPLSFGSEITPRASSCFISLASHCAFLVALDLEEGEVGKTEEFLCFRQNVLCETQVCVFPISLIALQPNTKKRRS